MRSSSFVIQILYIVALVGLGGCTSPPDNDFRALQEQDSREPAAHRAYFEEEAATMTGVPLVEGNHVDILQNGNATLPAMLAAVNGARHTIHMESFTFDEGAGADFAKALIAKRHEGVAVDLIYDGVGSTDTPPAVFDELRNNGVVLLPYNPIDLGSILSGDFNRRDHRKLLIVDGETAYLGGVNISSVYLYKKALRRLFGLNRDDVAHLPWRDTHVKIDGPVVADYERAYRAIWQEEGGKIEDLGPELPLPPRRGEYKVQAVLQTPQEGRFDIYKSLLLAITLSQKSVHLTTGYLAPTPDFIDALEDAARRGVEVVLLVPSVSDSDAALSVGHDHYAELLEAGVKIYEYRKAVLHAKTAVIDGSWSTVGSFNLDWRSSVTNNEANAIIWNSSFAAQMEALFQEDLTKSDDIDPDAWDDRPWDDTINEQINSLFDYYY